MNATSKRKTQRKIVDALLIAVFLGGAWAVGFLLGFG